MPPLKPASAVPLDSCAAPPRAGAGRRCVPAGVLLTCHTCVVRGSKPCGLLLLLALLP